MPATPPPPEDPGGLADERSFVLALGGFAVELAGGRLVTHERIGAERFNFIEGPYLAADRLTAFFERALDHYFQRALRPRVRRLRPVPAPVEAALRRLGFVAAPEPLLRLGALPDAALTDRETDIHVTPVDPQEERTAELWTNPAERDELRRAIDVVVHHPNDGERLVPLFAHSGDEVVGGVILYRNGPRASVQWTSTIPSARGQGVATALVAAALRHAAELGVDRLSLLTENPRLARRLEPLGFQVDQEFAEYRLPADVQLAMPPPGPPGPPRWRPPREGRA